ncbi:flagellar motor switch protein FliN/FliY [Desulfurobacterium pacificum]|jgi:flagellar motor switch protein FliN/FliY|uniref:Flagellar motor switch protein FliN/FliY n=1 Tax=Desulfurobacterium pacificum TaxID=240166 RepID=A0ABY1NNV7_9BACT|nr:FliM/FliN family flagellar motor switch protein [Desulfurobacterium pacificum]SMP13813.1 flagellar motor switch protein FliN/FliY [Desulfurobacterium pacificum]
MAENREKLNIERFKDVKLRVSFVISGKEMPFSKVMKLKEGDLIEFEDKKVEDYLDVLLNGQKFGIGELVVVNDKISLRLVDLV